MKNNIILGIAVICIAIFISACTTQDTKDEAYVKRDQVISVETEPTSYRKYALVSSGNINVSKSLTTDGPLADVHANGEIKARALSLDISGKITSSNSLDNSIIRSYDYISGIETEKFVDIRALKVNEYLNTNNLDEYYLLSGNGEALHKIKDNNDTNISASGAEFVFENNQWIIKGNSVALEMPLIVETNLKIESNNLFIAGTLMVQGDLNSSGELNINTGTPFDKALIVDKNIEVDKLIAIGRVHGSGTFTSHNEVNILGNAEIDGNVTLYGDAKINYLDNIFKAALYEAQEEAAETNSSMMLVHSQLFSNALGKNSVVLFTFVEGNYILNEKTLFDILDSNETEELKFKSFLYGATIDYGAQLQKFSGLSPYYANKLAIAKKFKSQGYENVKISESLDIAPSNLYHTYEDGNGNNIGTYQVYSLSSAFDINNPTLLTQTQRDEAIYNLEHKDEIEAEHELEAEQQAQLQKQAVLDNNETNATAKEEQLAEMTSVENNVSSIDKEALKLEITQDRVQEWVEYKDLADESMEVNATEIVVQDDTAVRGWKKRWKKRLKRVFRVVTFTYCIKKTSAKNIAHVSNSTNWNTYRTDLWSSNISLNNNGNNYCTPISASMILNYHRIRKGKPSLYSTDRSTVERYSAATDNNYVSNMAAYIGTSTKSGTSVFSLYTLLPNAITLNLAINKTYGYTWSLPTLFQYRDREHYLLTKHIDRNNPLIYSTAGNVGKIDGKHVSSHTMPVIGYKKEYYHGVCYKTVMPDKKWIYVDTTWRHSASYNDDTGIRTDANYGNSRGYLRFDSRSNYLTVGTLTYVSVK